MRVVSVSMRVHSFRVLTNSLQPGAGRWAHPGANRVLPGPRAGERGPTAALPGAAWRTFRHTGRGPDPLRPWERPPHGARSAGTGMGLAHPRVHHRLGVRGGSMVCGASSGLGALTPPPGRKPAPPGTGPRAVDGRGPLSARPVPRPHETARTRAAPGAARIPQRGTRGPVSWWRLLAACSTRGHERSRIQRADTRTPARLATERRADRAPCVPLCAHARPGRARRAAARRWPAAGPAGTGYTTTPSGAAAPSCARDPCGRSTPSCCGRSARSPAGSAGWPALARMDRDPPWSSRCRPGGSVLDPAVEHGASSPCAPAQRSGRACALRPAAPPGSGGQRLPARQPARGPLRAALRQARWPVPGRPTRWGGAAPFARGQPCRDRSLARRVAGRCGVAMGWPSHLGKVTPRLAATA